MKHVMMSGHGRGRQDWVNVFTPLVRSESLGDMPQCARVVASSARATPTLLRSGQSQHLHDGDDLEELGHTAPTTYAGAILMNAA